jgi:hypothetical protein
MKNFFNSIKRFVFFSFLSGFYLTNHSLGQNQSYLDGLPSKSDIVSKIKGHNTKETYAKQIAALEIMYEFIIFHKLEEKTKFGFTVKENALLKDYNWKDLIDKYSKIVGPQETPEKRREFQIYTHNFVSDELEVELVNNFFSVEAKNQYEKTNKIRIEERKKRSNNKTKAIIILVAGIAFLIGWASLKIWKRKPQFNGRKENDVEKLNTYTDLGEKRIAKESIGWVSLFVLIIGIGLIIYGLYLLSLLN